MLKGLSELVKSAPLWKRKHFVTSCPKLLIFFPLVEPALICIHIFKPNWLT